MQSLGTFENEGYAVNMKNGKAKVIKGSLVFLTGTRRNNNTYTLDESMDVRYVSIVKDNGKINVVKWHMRLGHAINQGLVELKKQYEIKDLKSCEFDVYENCIMGKARKVKLTKLIHRCKGVLDYVHADFGIQSRMFH